MLQNAIASADRINEILRTRQEMHVRDGRKDVRHLKGHVEFRNVSLAYNKSNHALTGVSFEALPGEVVAIMGPTGSGKSSIINLISRFYDATDGKVLVDGTDVKNYRMASLRRHIGIVAQETFLFNATIQENIAFARPGATLEEVKSVAKTANIHDYIMSLPQNYDTVVGERGVNLSGGQKQRISIARALLKDPTILILDDSTSALDTETELMIHKELRSAAKARTVLMIAHRISTVKQADRIVVLNEGRVAEVGTHDELVDAGGLYSEIYNIQLSGQETEDSMVTEGRSYGST
jgi:ABC-type multidrug transport system fused ATPase/permease subunit